MLSTDERILDDLLKAKNEGNKLLEHFHINFPDKKMAQEINSIYVAVVDAENNTALLSGGQTFTDLVEIIITTKKVDYRKSIDITKILSKEIVRVLKNDEYLGQRLIIRKISPLYEKSTHLLKKGHILVQFKTDKEEWLNSPDEYEKCCEFLTNIKVE